MSAVIVAAAAVGMFACLCGAMSRGRGDRAYPVRPVPPRRRPVASARWVDPGPVDPDAPWRDPLNGALLDGLALTQAELRAAVEVSRRYPEAYRHLLAEALDSDGPEHPDSAPDGAPQVAEAANGGTPRG